MTFNYTVQIEAMLWDGLSNPIDVLQMLKEASVRSMYKISDDDGDGKYRLLLSFESGKMAGCEVSIDPGEYIVMDHVGNVYTLSADEFTAKNFEAVK